MLTATSVAVLRAQNGLTERRGRQTGDIDLVGGQPALGRGPEHELIDGGEQAHVT